MADKKALVSATAGQVQQIQTGDVLTAPNFSTAGNYISGQDYLSSTTVWIGATNGAGTCYLRPNGTASATGQLLVASTGNITVNGTVTASQNFTSSTTAAILATTGAGTVYLRPNGAGSASQEITLDSAGLLTINGGNTRHANYGEFRFNTGNGKGRINHEYFGITDYFTLSANYDRTGAATGTIDNAALATAEVQLLANNGSAGTINLMVGAVNTAPSTIATVSTTGVAVTGTVSDTIGDLRIAVQNVQNTAYTLVAADKGKLLTKNDATARTHTIPANATVAYPIGTMLTFVNDNATSNLTIAITTDTMYLAGTTTTGSRTLAPRGLATAIKAAATVWYISGSGLS